MLSINASMLCELLLELALEVLLVELLEVLEVLEPVELVELELSVGGGGITPPFSAIMLSRLDLSAEVSSDSLREPSPFVSYFES